MKVRIGLALVRALSVAAAMLWLSAPAHAAGNWEVGKTLHTANGCTDCHARKDGASISDITNAIATQAPMNALFSASGSQPLSADNISDISAYLNHLTFPLASLDQSSFSFSPLSIDLTATHSFRLTNNGDANLNVSGASVSSTGYSVNAVNCTSAPVGPGGHCDVVVTFAPLLAAAYNGRTLTINHNTFSGTSTATINGTGLVQFAVSATLLEFTALTAPTGVLTTTITDNKGDRIRICRVAASTFSFPSDFSIDAPFALAGDGCFTSLPTATPPRSMPLNVRFVAGAIGPRNADLTIQRVDGVGTGVGAITTVQLRGNPGPLASIDASSLFDAVSDPGVEVDNDNVLDRGVTVFSQGSDPLVFNGTTFTISGPNASEYSVLPTGCRALGGLAAGVTSPSPSCVLTVRFNPAGLGRRGPATLTIQVAGAPVRTVSLNGLGIFGPRLEVSQIIGPISSGSSLNFGAQTIAGLYPPRILTLRNGGTLGNLEVVVPASASTPGFTLTPDAACSSLAPATQCSLAVHFDPTQVQTYSANLVLQSRPAGSAAAYDAFNLTLIGEGSASALPNLVWTDSSGTVIGTLAFGNANVGSPVNGTVRLRNDGPGGVVLSLVNAVGTGASSFILDASACANGTTLYENASCAVGVQFAPGSAGVKSALLQAVTAAGSPTVSVLAPQFVISGTGIGGSAPLTLAASTTSLAFSATVGAQSLPLELTVTNTGASGLQVTGYEISAGYAVTEKSCAKAPFALAPGAQCSLVVTFNPQSEGVVQGVLQVRVDGQATTLDVALSGNAAPKADVSGGGCTLAVGDPRSDPTLWLLVLFAAGVLWLRRRRPARRTPASIQPKSKSNSEREQ